MTSEDFQKRLKDAFEYDGKPYGRVFMIHESEGEYGLEAAKFSGHLSLSDGFKACFLEAAELLNTHCRPLVKTPLSEFYPQLLPRLVNGWHTLCGAERAALSGYPRPAFTTLRNVFDDNVLTSAALQKITDFYKIEGIDPQDKSGKIDPIAIKKARINNEYAVRKVMTGWKSGLQSVDGGSRRSPVADRRGWLHEGQGATHDRAEVWERLVGAVHEPLYRGRVDAAPPAAGDPATGRPDAETVDSQVGDRR